MSIQLRNDGPEVAERCDFCTHPWTEHQMERGVGCTHGWLYDREGIATTDGCMCRLAHTEVVSA